MKVSPDAASATAMATCAIERQDEQAALRALVARMGGLAEAAIAEAVAALLNRDAAAAAAVVIADARIDALETEIEARVVQLVVSAGPDADGVRALLSALKIANAVERIGDYAKNIARRVPMLLDVGGIAPLRILPAMAGAAADMLHDVLDAFAARDPRAAELVCASDRAVDEIYASLIRALLEHMAANPGDIEAATHLLFVAKNLERIGDQATNIAEKVVFAATGEAMVARRRLAVAHRSPAA